MFVDEYIKKVNVVSGERFRVKDTFNHTCKSFKTYEEAEAYMTKVLDDKERLENEMKNTEKYANPYPDNLMWELHQNFNIVWEDYDYVQEHFDENLLVLLSQGYIKPREYQILMLKYKESLTLRGVGKSVDLTQERVRQIINKTMYRINSSKAINVLQYGKKYIENHKTIVQLEQEIMREKAKLLKELDSIKNKTYVPTKEEKEESKMDIPLECMDLSVRTYNCFYRNGLTTLQDVLKFIDNDVTNLLKIRNLGRKSLIEVVEKLGEYNVKFFEWQTREDILNYFNQR